MPVEERYFECCPDDHACSRVGKWSLRCAQVFPIFFVAFLLISSIYVFFVRLCIDYLIYGEIPRTVQGALYICAYWILFCLCTYCYARAALGSPGSPDDFTIKICSTAAEEQAAQAPAQFKRIRNQAEVIYLPRSLARMCGLCNAPKPPRTHHCSTCRHCFLKMDHHCVWLNNCVGFGNYKYFFCLLFWATFMCGFVFGATLEVLIQQLVYDELTGFSVVWLILTFFSFALGMSTLMLLCYHCWLIARGMSTIEHMEISEEREDWKRRSRLNRTGSHADLLACSADDRAYSEGSVYRNICAALGKNPLLWLIPYNNVPGNGIRFQASELRSQNKQIV